MAQEEINHEKILREMYRRSKDIIRVYNPLDIDFKFKWDSVWHTVKAHNDKDIERYLAKKFRDDIISYMLGVIAIEDGTKMLELRRERGMVDFLNKYDENVAIWNNVQKLNDAEKIKELASQVWIGLVEEYGAEEAPDFEPQLEQEDPTISHMDNVLKELDEKVAPRRGVAPAKPIKEDKEKLSQEVSL